MLKDPGETSFSKRKHGFRFEECDADTESKAQGAGLITCTLGFSAEISSIRSDCSLIGDTRIYAVDLRILPLQVDVHFPLDLCFEVDMQDLGNPE